MLDEQVIYGAGYSEAQIMVVGDYARKYDESTKECLSGYYEKKLDDLFKDNGYSVDKVYRTCVIKLYYKGLGSGNFKQDTKLMKDMYIEYGTSINYFIDHLVRELNEIKPSVIIAMGEFALRTLVGKESITKWRGSMVPLRPEIQDQVSRKGIKVVCSLHPSEIQIDESNLHLLRLDFKKAVELVFNPNRQIDAHNITIFRNCGELIRFIGRYKKPTRMVTDIETRYGIITCASISFDGINGGTIPMYGATHIELLERCRMMYILSELLMDETIGKGNQNIDYDKRIYQRFGFRLKPVVWDTMTAAGVITTEFPKRLGFLTSIYTDMSYYKDEGRQLDSEIFDWDQYYNYCAKDSISTFQIWDKQREDLIELEMLEFFENFMMPLWNMYYKLESIGWKIDLRKRDELAAKYDGFYNLKMLELQALTGKIINMNSPAQIGRYMEENKFPVIRHRTDGGNMAVSTGLDELKKMKTYDPSKYRDCTLPYNLAIRYLDLVLLLRRIDKVVEYIQVGIHPWGRVYTNVNLTGTGSGRTSGSKTPDQIPLYVEEKGKLHIKMVKLGQSFQTVTKHGFIIEGEEDIDAIGDIIGADLREMYIPDDDFFIIEADGAQAEARVVDILAEDWEGLAEYGKIDKHCKVASYIYTQYTYEELVRMAKVEKSDLGLYMRQIGKRGKHANNLGVGAYVLSMTASITQSEAKDILTKLDLAYPKTREIFHKGVEEILRSARMLFNPFGRKRMFLKKIDGHYVKVAYSFLPQSIVSDNTKRAMLEIDARVDNEKAWLIAENHDSITGLVRRGYAREYMRIAKEAMERPIDMRRCSLSRDYMLSIPAEFSIGRHNWGSLKEIKKVDRLLLKA